MIAIMIVFLSSLVASFIALKESIKEVKELDYTGKKDLGLIVPDLHKEDEPLIPKVGGIGIIAGLVIGLTASIGYVTFLTSEPATGLLGILATILIIGFLAFIDDIVQIRQIIRAFVPTIASLPLIAIKAGVTAMTVPFFGKIEFGVLYYGLVALGVTGASNATNMLAGYNGLETGTALIIFTSLFAYSVHVGTSIIVPLALASAIGAYLALLYYNIYPAKVIPGMSNYIIGAVIASVAIVGNMERVAVMMFPLFFIEFLLKAREGFKNTWWGELTEDGKLKSASNKIETIPQAIMELHGSVSERILVAEIWAIQLVVSFSVLLYLW